MFKNSTQLKFIPVSLGLLLTFAALFIPESSGPLSKLSQRLEGLAYDFRYNLTSLKSKRSEQRIVIVSIDEKSLAQEGRWPWPRSKVAKLTDILFQNKAVVVGFDILFTEPQTNVVNALTDKLDRNTHLSLINQLETLSEKLDDDRRFALSLQNRDIVLSYIFHTENAQSTGSLPPAIILRKDIDWDMDIINTLPHFTASLSSLTKASSSTGFITTLHDPDGILRRSPMLLRHGDGIYTSFSLELAKTFFLLEKININTTPIGDEQKPDSISIASKSVPIDEFGQAMIPFRGPSPSFRTVSAGDVLRGKFLKDVFENKIVIVGSTALGLGDFVSTPVQTNFPGVEVHASLLAGILDENFPVKPNWAKGANLFITLLLGLILAFIMPMLTPASLAATGFLVATGFVTVNTWLWYEKSLVLNVAVPTVLILALTTINMAYGFVIEAHQRGKLKRMFGQYVPPQLVDSMILAPRNANYDMESESRDMTVLFADIRGFTSIAEKLDPNELKKLLNQFFNHMTQTIFQHQGTIDKYVGDMIMAFWGAPMPNEHHAQDAVLTAMDMQAKVELIKPEFRVQGLPEINLGIGVNSGLMNVGDMGSEYRRAYTVIGDAVNLASRLENLTKYYGATIVIGENSYHQLKNIVCRTLDRVKVPGKSTAITVYQPLCLRSELTSLLEEELQQHHAALTHYWAQQWQQAGALFQRLQETHPDNPIYDLYLQRLQQIQHLELGPDWDGIYERRDK